MRKNTINYQQIKKVSDRNTTTQFNEIRQMSSNTLQTQQTKHTIQKSLENNLTTPNNGDAINYPLYDNKYNKQNELENLGTPPIPNALLNITSPNNIVYKGNHSVPKSSYTHTSNKNEYNLNTNTEISYTIKQDTLLNKNNCVTIDNDQYKYQDICGKTTTTSLTLQSVSTIYNSNIKPTETIPQLVRTTITNIPKLQHDQCSFIRHDLSNIDLDDIQRKLTSTTENNASDSNTDRKIPYDRFSVMDEMKNVLKPFQYPTHDQMYDQNEFSKKIPMLYEDKVPAYVETTQTKPPLVQKNEISEQKSRSSHVRNTRFSGILEIHVFSVIFSIS
jgi:hypothetical protein